ncbi:membrane protein insertion efficiency factor YidD [Streptococcaceae bacterium ESL0729]|nr:membrane protein insertion efficiency factor YidD [Streptococcaceae bacterium ESL0729]
MKNLLLKMVYFYQRRISPLTGPTCRYHPTCSNYMVEALKSHGAFLGTIMGLARILRCNPLVRGGIDYVPEKFSLRRNKDKR